MYVKMRVTGGVTRFLAGRWKAFKSCFSFICFSLPTHDYQ